MKEHPSFPWDHYSDQPRIMRDKKLKHKIYLRASGQMLKSAFLLVLLPFFILISFIKKPWRKTKTDRCIGLSVHVETECEGKTIVPLDQVTEMVDDLGVQQLLVRIPLADFENFDNYIKHIDTLSTPEREISVNIIQSRIVLDDPVLLTEILTDLLNRLKGKVEFIHVGNAYNRRKWAFYHFGEFHRFFQAIRSSCNEIAPEIKLIGGSAIDFEIPTFLESLFHFRPGHYDGYSSQLYVDRRGAPENTQSGFNFLRKINLIDTMRSYSWKARGPLWISEINWPLQDSGKFSPCKGEALVDQQTQADYLVRAYLIAIASGKIRTCYWHQLIAPGYGLVDNRKDTVIKRPSYHAFKTLNMLFHNAEIFHFDNGNYQGIKGLYKIEASTYLNNKPTTIHVFWSNSGKHLIRFTADRWLDQYGKLISFEDNFRTPIDSSVHYALVTR